MLCLKSSRTLLVDTRRFLLVRFAVGQLDFARRHLARDNLVDEQTLGRRARHNRGAGLAAFQHAFSRAQIQPALLRRSGAVTGDALGGEDRFGRCLKRRRLGLSQ